MSKDKSIFDQNTQVALDNYTKQDYKYTYDGIRLLKSGVPTCNSLRRIVLYRIVKTSAKPFLMFCLYREDDLLRLATMKYKREGEIEHIVNKMDGVFKGWDANITYMGYTQEEDGPLLWLEYKSDILYTREGKQDDRWWWVLSTEIVNYKRMMYMKVDDYVTNIFLNKPMLLFLKDENNKLYESPAIGYYGSYSDYIAITVALGLKRARPLTAFGPYYYFGAYKQALRYSLWSRDRKPYTIDGKSLTDNANGRWKRGGLVRFAIFLGKTNMLLGRKTDKMDSSEISQQLMKTDTSQRFTRDAVKLRDSDAKWIYNFNSIKRADGKDVLSKDLGTRQLTVVKEYNQQEILGYYYINTHQKNVDIGNARVDLDNIRIE